MQISQDAIMPHDRTISILSLYLLLSLGGCLRASRALLWRLETQDGQKRGGGSEEAGRQERGSGEAGKGRTRPRQLEGGQRHANLRTGLLVIRT